MAKNTIKLKKYVDIIEERNAVAAITPGMLIELTSADKYQAHSSAGGNASPTTVALEDELQGNGIDDNYAADNPVQAWIPQRGEQAYMILADGESVVIGDELESNGDGNLRKLTSGTPIAASLETIDLSDSSGGESSGALGYNKRIEVQIV